MRAALPSSVNHSNDYDDDDNSNTNSNNNNNKQWLIGLSGVQFRE